METITGTLDEVLQKLSNISISSYTQQNYMIVDNNQIKRDIVRQLEKIINLPLTEGRIIFNTYNCKQDKIDYNVINVKILL